MTKLIELVRFGIIGLREDHPILELEDLSVWDMRRSRKTHHYQVESVFREALAFLKGCEGDYYSLVTSNIRTIFIEDVAKMSDNPLCWTLSMPLSPALRQRPLSLAIILVSVAAYFEVLRLYPWYLRISARSPEHHAVSRDAAWAFASHFPDSEEWKRHLQ
jgi:hypothetical protein